MSKKLGVLFLVFCFLGCNITHCSESFVVKKSKKKPKSKSKMQDQLCSYFTDQMSMVPDVHKKIADLQQALFDQTYKYLENSKECVLIKSNKEKIDAMQKKAEDFREKMECFCKECDEYLAYLK